MRAQPIRELLSATPALAAALSLALLLATSPARAENLVENPDFATVLAPWAGVGSSAPDPAGAGVASWTDLHDVDGAAPGGSADVTLAGGAPQAANTAFGVRQCVPLPGAPLTVTEAHFEASFLAPTTNPADGLANATVEVRFFSDGACASFVPGAGGSQGMDLTVGLLGDTAWYTIGDPQLLLPGDAIEAASAEVRAFVRTVGTTSGSYRVFFDHVVLTVNGALPVELRTMEVR